MSTHPDTQPEWPESRLRAVNTKLLRPWYDECVSKLNYHRRRATWVSRMNVIFGLPITVLSAITGTAAFATLGAQVGTRWQLVVAFISVTIVLLSTIQTFFRFPDQAKKHQDGVHRYLGIYWEIRDFVAYPRKDPEEAYYTEERVQNLINFLRYADEVFQGVEQQPPRAVGPGYYPSSRSPIDD